MCDQCIGGGGGGGGVDGGGGVGVGGVGVKMSVVVFPPGSVCVLGLASPLRGRALLSHHSTRCLDACAE